MNPKTATIAIALSVTLICCAPFSLRALPSDPLEFRATVVGDHHPLNKRLVVEVRIHNRSDKTLYVYSDLDYFIDVFAFTADGAALPPGFIAQSLPPPPGRDDFTRLSPGHFLGFARSDPLPDLGINKPGRYRLVLEYRSNFTSEMAFGLPVWAGHLSATVEFTVEP